MKITRTELRILVMLWHKRTLTADQMAAASKHGNKDPAMFAVKFVGRLRKKGVPISHNTGGIYYIPEAFKKATR